MPGLKHTRYLLTRSIAALAFLSAPMAFAADEDVLPATGDDIEVYTHTNDWTVFKNNTRQSCFITWSEDGSTAVQMGLTADKEFVYLGAFVRDLEPLEEGSVVAIVINGNTYVGGSTTVRQTLTGRYKGAYVLSNNPQFIKDIEEAEELIAFPDAPYRVTVTLDGARGAVIEGRKCTVSF